MDNYMPEQVNFDDVVVPEDLWPLVNHLEKKVTKFGHLKE